MTALARRLEQLAVDLCAGRPLAPADAIVVGRALRSVLRVPTATMATVIRTEGIRERDLAIVELALRHCGALSGLRTKATRIASWWVRYEAGRWRQDQHHVNLPKDIEGLPQEHLWMALRAHGRVLRADQIRNILEASMR